MNALTFGQAAARLGVDTQQVRRWARHEECPVISDGRRKLIPAGWVDEQRALLKM